MDNRSGINADGRGRNGGGGVSVSSISIPASSMKIIQGLKEIVNCSEQEIYAMLKECNMDPNEAISRLISQDPFHEVRSRREKKKENKDIAEPKSRSTSTPNRGSRGAERYTARGSSNQSSPYDSGVSHGRSTQKKDSGQTSSFSSFSSASRAPSSSYTSQLPVFSDSAPFGNTMSDEGGYPSTQPSSASHHSWLGAPGQLSMAEVVRMGRPQVKSCSTIHKYEEVPDSNHKLAPASTSQFHDNLSSTVSQVTAEAGVASTNVFRSDDEWPLFEQPPASSLNLAQELPDNENLNGCEGSSVLNSKEVENVAGESGPDDNSYENISSLHSPGNPFESHDGGADRSSFAENLEMLNLQDDKQAQPENDHNSVKIPSHLQVHSEDFSHLSFGSFGSAPVGGLTAPFSSAASNNDGESSAMDPSPVEQPDTKNGEYFINEHSLSTSVENYNGQNSSSCEPSSVSSPERLKSENHEAAPKDQYSFPSSSSGYSPETSHHLNPSPNFSEPSSQIMNQTSFSNPMPFQDSLPNPLVLTQSSQETREAEFPYSPFSVIPPPNYNNVVPVTSSSITAPPSSLALPEVQQKEVPSNINNVQSILRGGGGGGGGAPPQQQHHHHHHHLPPLQQHPPYAQPGIPATHFTNMIGYPLIPQSYPYVPSAFQHMFGGANSYPHHSLPPPPVLPSPYKNTAALSPHHQHSAMAAAAAGYGSFGNSGGTFSHNQPSPAGGASSPYEDVVLSQYKEENGGMWGQRGGGTYYEGANQTLVNMRQRPQVLQQQQQQHYGGGGGGGYQSVYHSVEHQQLNPRGGDVAAQGHHGKHQMWQSSY